uniref:Uncharacterized protein n=1 Tax=Candidatus Kentrum sp. DK TaxID=2126562 RepID=A0A450TFZ8_9GAMM|nr:MAG: hypothetical protein BECKDK2373B_GA0170837_103522 [Candidatus Kentron sp. DK]VFJ66126.1 MAG: hypothetical protein BECKDK2373C_GA0170839_11425 [Candidatus Kentron sp. DK]
MREHLRSVSEKVFPVRLNFFPLFRARCSNLFYEPAYESVLHSLTAWETRLNGKPFRAWVSPGKSLPAHASYLVMKHMGHFAFSPDETQ